MDQLLAVLLGGYLLYVSVRVAPWRSPQGARRWPRWVVAGGILVLAVGVLWAGFWEQILKAHT